jgi:LysM repeat protein
MNILYKKSHAILFITLILFSSIAICQYQLTTVEKSTEKILYQGKTYFLHTVKQGQTIYSICKVYSITEQQISGSNPGVTINPLSSGVTLKIPAASETNPVIVDQSSNVSEDANFYYHTVLSQENTYSLHNKYNIPLELIFKFNPGSEKGIRTGQVIRIPKKTEIEISHVTQQQTAKQYEVHEGDSIYRVAEKFGITISDIFNANKELRWGFKPGQVIIIPEAGYRPSPDLSKDTVVEVSQRFLLTSSQCDSIALLKRMRAPIKIALLLPFYADESFSADTLSDSDSIAENGARADHKSFKGLAAVEFYEGFLLAVDTLKKKHESISLFVYDTKADTNIVKRLLKELDIIEPDLIIGPMTTEETRLISKFAFEHLIPVVPPLTNEDSKLSYNPLLIQTIPTHTDEIYFYARYIAQFNNKNIILITKPGLQQYEENILFGKALKEQAAKYYGIDSLIYTEISIDDAIKSKINKSLKRDKDNIVIVLSTYEPDVINVLAHLHFMLRDYKIEAFGLPQWQRFDNIRVDVLHELQVTLYSPFYIDYSNPHVKSFVKKCRNALKFEPFKTTAKGTGINYAYLGYDIGFYFIDALYYYQKNICDCIEYKKEKLLLSNYNYSKSGGAGNYVNKNISILRYNREFDLELIPFK